MATASTYSIPASATPGTNETGMQTAATCSVIGRGGVADAASCYGVPIGASVAGGTAPAWTFTKVAPLP